MRRLVLALLTTACASTSSSSAGPVDDDEAFGPPKPKASAPPATPGEPSASSPRPRQPHAILRSEVERATGRGPAYFIRQLGPEAFRHHGQFVGWQLTRVFPDDPTLCAPACDIEVGDVILSVNGSRLETPQQLSDAFAALPKTEKLVVHSLREGKRREVTYRIVPDPS